MSSLKEEKKLNKNDQKWFCIRNLSLVGIFPGVVFKNDRRKSRDKSFSVDYKLQRLRYRVSQNKWLWRDFHFRLSLNICQLFDGVSFASVPLGLSLKGTTDKIFLFCTKINLNTYTFFAIQPQVICASSLIKKIFWWGTTAGF